ncbi:MAG: winged helix-turn-helix transcriptional regulator [Candidatus Odinarchaeota archaeon]
MRIKGTIIFLVFSLSIFMQLWVLSIYSPAISPGNHDVLVQTSTAIFQDFSEIAMNQEEYGLTSIEQLVRIALDDSGTICFIYEITGNKAVSLLILPAFIFSSEDVGIDTVDMEQGSLREMVYQVISSQPGIHFRELCRKLNRKNGVVQYHLWTLESIENRIKSHQDGRFTRYFPVNGKLPSISSDSYYNLISVLKHPTMYDIVNLLRDAENGLSRKVLASELGITRQSVTFNCKKLSTAGIIEETCRNREKHYLLTDETMIVLNQLDKEV